MTSSVGLIDLDLEKRTVTAKFGETYHSIRLADETLGVAVRAAFRGDDRCATLLGFGSTGARMGSDYAVIVAKVNRDKGNDLVAASVDSVAVFLGDKGGFVPASGSPFRAGPGDFHLATEDIQDKLDTVASSFEGNAVTLLLVGYGSPRRASSDSCQVTRPGRSAIARRLFLDRLQPGDRSF